jgi:hypothetical protein
MKEKGSMAAIFERQWIHAVALVVMLVALWLISRGCSCFHRGELWGIGTWTWFWIAVAVPIAHQIVVWFCWRTELHRGLMSRVFGRHGFTIYAVMFTVLFVGRLLVIIALAEASRNTLPVNHTLLKTLAVVIAIPAVYLFYSVARYFGIKRAFGADHFDETYRTMPLVRDGIFRFTSNGMYTFGLLVVYIPALWSASRPALIAALFNHAYIWVHYFSTELPDMRRIYGSDP